MKLKSKMCLLAVILPLLLGAFIVPETSYSFAQSDTENIVIDLSNGDVIEIAPDEVLQEYVLSDGGTGKRVKRYIEDALKQGHPIDAVWCIPAFTSSEKKERYTLRPYKMI